jgi:hypothetical protein
MDLDLSANPSLESLEGDSLVKPGWFHVLIESATYVADRSPCIKLALRILEGKHKSQIGLRFSERVYTTPASMNRLKTLAGRLGLINKADFGKNTRVNWGDAVGKQLVVRVTNEDFEGKNGKQTSNKPGYMDFFGPHDARVADKPKSLAAMENPKSVLSGPALRKDEVAIDDLDGI